MSANIRLIRDAADKEQFEKDLNGFRSEQNALNMKYGLPSDFFMSELTRNHFTLAVAGLAIIETLINQVAHREFKNGRKDSEMAFGYLLNRVETLQKTRILKALSYSADRIKFITALAEVRNRYAQASLWGEAVIPVQGISGSHLR